MALPETLPPRSDGIRVCLEVFLVNLAGENAVRYIVLRKDITGHGQNPDDLALDLALSRDAGSVTLSRMHCYVHSTSWRYEQDGAIMLTYLVYSDQMEFQRDAGSVLRLEDVPMTVSANAARPRPVILMDEHIVAHGIRHLSYLAKTGNRNLLDVISQESIRRFRAMEGLLAGKFN